MKQTKTIVTVILVAAILVAAYAIGLLIRHARAQREIPTAAATAQELVDQQAPGGRAGRKVQTDTRAQKEKMIQKVNSMTEEEQRRFTEEQVLKRVSARNSREQTRELSSQEREKALTAWQNMSAEEKKKALQDKLGQDTGRNDAEPNEAGHN